MHNMYCVTLKQSPHRKIQCIFGKLSTGLHRIKKQRKYYLLYLWLVTKNIGISFILDGRRFNEKDNLSN